MYSTIDKCTVDENVKIEKCTVIDTHRKGRRISRRDVQSLTNVQSSTKGELTNVHLSLIIDKRVLIVICVAIPILGSSFNGTAILPLKE